MGVSRPEEASEQAQGPLGQGTSDMEKSTVAPRSQDVSGYSSDDPSERYQNGVQGVRAITSVWSKYTLWSMFALTYKKICVSLYLISFFDYLQNAIDSSLNPFITSSFGSHGLLNVGSILSTIVGGCAPLALAKIIDIWGRVEGFVGMLTICVIGMIMKATCESVEMYVSAHVLYWTGHIGMAYVIEVMISDMTSLRNRMIIFTLNGTPRIASTFAGPAIADLFLENVNFRWAFGAFAIILVAFSIPAMGLMVYMSRQASKAGLIHKERSGRTWVQSISHYAIELDLFGVILITGALSCLLLPYSLASYAPDYWSTPYIIAMEVLGVVLFPIFYLWEAKFAPVQFLPFKYLKQGTIIGSCLLYGIMFLSTFTWNSYLYSYLQVVHREGVKDASYILNAYSLTASILSPLVAWFISYTGNFKWTAYAGVPIMLLGTALILPLRHPKYDGSVIAGTQVIVGLGSGIFTTCSQIAVMAPVTHQQLAVANALAGLFGGVGAAVGLAIAGGLWNNLLPKELKKRLPEAAKADSRTIFGDIVLQMSFADGSPEREAIVGAYSHVMRYMVITGVCLMPLCLASIFIWKNINIRKLEEEKGKQTKGTVF
ncbi:siderophore iron transporter MirB [Geosmithia morbida]|uniref:Siderophore iron transporter MirB n=1 Tax=Geosmithia morbida TaxID=1094350 RepID=A0A9P4YR24_9HYPO|nr:siderophore iron transporter MirB [Geosmithia morbida]KAF4119474.1 siderophore iron transporter MirB [Geosmithia morbida]